jgi:hypothetical protein
MLRLCLWLPGIGVCSRGGHVQIALGLEQGLALMIILLLWLQGSEIVVADCCRRCSCAIHLRLLEKLMPRLRQFDLLLPPLFSLILPTDLRPLRLSLQPRVHAPQGVQSRLLLLDAPLVLRERQGLQAHLPLRARRPQRGVHVQEERDQRVRGRQRRHPRGVQMRRQGRLARERGRRRVGQRPQRRAQLRPPVRRWLRLHRWLEILRRHASLLLLLLQRPGRAVLWLRRGPARMWLLLHGSLWRVHGVRRRHRGRPVRMLLLLLLWRRMGMPMVHRSLVVRRPRCRCAALHGCAGVRLGEQ